MKQSAILVEEFGKESEWKVGKIDIPKPKDGEILINIKSAGINPADWKIKEFGALPGSPLKMPVVIGWDLAGVCVEVGFGVSQFKKGDEVYCNESRLAFGPDKGTFCEYICLPASWVSKKPKSLSFVEASTVPLAALTAYQAYELIEVKKGEIVLVLGATGGTGSNAIQIGRILGLKTIGVASTKNHEYMKKLGANFAIDYKGDVVSEVKKIAPEGVDAIIDCFGNGGLNKYQILAKKNGGRMVTIADPQFKSTTIPCKTFFVNPNAVQLTQIAKWFDEKKMIVNVEKVYDFKDIKEAMEHQKKGLRGKLALKINP